MKAVLAALALAALPALGPAEAVAEGGADQAAEGGAAGPGLTLPQPARLATAVDEPYGTVRLPIAPAVAGEVQSLRAEGTVRHEAWQIGSAGLTVAQVMAPLREQVLAAGFEVLLDCAEEACGGFAFRFATDTLPAPDMHVDLGDYRYLSARRSAEDGTRWLALMVSRAPDRAFVQITRVVPVAAAASLPATEAAATSLPPRAQPAPGTLAVALARQGRAVLDGIRFGSGSAEMDGARVPALAELAEWLEANPAARVVLVGHTDADGALPGNIDLSRRRATAVRARLVDSYGIAGERLRAEGVGYLAPLTTNETAEGRERNRRVEVVVDTVE